MNNRNQTSKTGKVVLTLLSLIIIGAGIAMISQAMQGIGMAHESLDWPKVNGRIIRSELVVSARDSRPGESGDLSARRQSKSFLAEIEYEFAVNGVTYTGQRIGAVKQMIGNASLAKSILARYPVGKEVEIAYHVDDPENCVLEPGSTGGAAVLIVLGGCFAILPVFLLRIVWKSRR